MHYMDSNKTAWEEAKQQLHKNAGGNTPQDTNCTATCLLSRKIFKLVEPGHCWRSRDELISDVLFWTPIYGRAKAGRPARTYIQQVCEDTGCGPEDLPWRWTIGNSGESGSGISVQPARHDDDDDDGDNNILE